VTRTVFTTGASVLTWLRTKPANSAGVPRVAVTPSSSRRFLTSGWASPRWWRPLMRWTISEASSPAPRGRRVVEHELGVAELADGRHVRGERRALCGGHRRAGRIWPVLKKGTKGGDDVNADRDHARDQVGGHRRTGSAVRHVRHLDAHRPFISSP
jgi:hypothetical protein